MCDHCSAGSSPASGLGLSHIPCSHSPCHTSLQVGERIPCTGFPLLRLGAGTIGVGTDTLRCIKPCFAKLRNAAVCQSGKRHNFANSEQVKGVED